MAPGARWGAVLCVAVAALAANAAAAEPSIWTRTREPSRAASERLLRRAERMLLDIEDSPAAFLGERARQERVILLLEGAGAEQIDDPRLWYLLGELYGSFGIERYADVRRLLEAALARAPEDPRAESALFELGNACAKLEDIECERDAFTRALEIAWEPERRVHALYNRADALMGLGDLPGSIADYRAAAALTRDRDQYALAEYGLAVALERSGDLPGALDAVARVHRVWPRQFSFSALDFPTVFFVPDYDLYYYKGVEALSVAREKGRAGERAGRLRALEQGIGYFSEYLAAAEPDGHRWAENARLRLGWAKHELARARSAPKARAR